MYISSGLADNLNNELLTRWNDVIKAIYDDILARGTRSPFFKLNPWWDTATYQCGH